MGGCNNPGVTAGVGSTEKLEAARRSLERDGYIVFDPGIPEGTLDATIERIGPEFRPEGAAGRFLRRAKRAVRGRHTAISHRDKVRLQDAWVISESVKAIARAPGVIEFLRAVYGREPLPFQTLNFKVGSQQRPHADAWHFNSEPSGFMCGIWVALEDIHEDCGPLIYYPASHKLPEVTKADMLARRRPADGPDANIPVATVYVRFVQSLIEREKLEPHYATLRKGEALLWSSNLIHGGAPQSNPAGTRWTQVTHYYFEGCRYWKPMYSGQGERQYWEPTWVR